MFLKYIKIKRKILYFVIATIVLAMACFNLQNNLMQVSAQVVPISVNYNHLDFGDVFPGEQLDKNFTVTSTATSGEAVSYKIIQKHKPLHDVPVPEGYNGTPSQYCQEFPEDYGHCYRNLCPYISKISLEEEGDVEAAAKVGPMGSDLSDTWIVNLNVPAIIGNVAQDHNGGLINEAGDYGCDISIDVDDEICAISGYKFNDIDRDGVKDEGENGLANWTIILNLPASEILSEELDVSGTGGISTSNNILTSTDNFRLEASGTYFAGGNSAEDIEADAKYSQDDYQAANNLPWTDSVRNYESYGPELLNLKVNNVFVDWGDFAADHIYFFDFPGNGAKADFQIYDIAPGNNSGSLNVKIFKKLASYNATTTTDSNGFYCFKDLPREGIYTVAEIMQNGWVNSTSLSREKNYIYEPITDLNFGNYQSTSGGTGSFRAANNPTSGGNSSTGIDNNDSPTVLGDESGEAKLNVVKSSEPGIYNPGQTGVKFKVTVTNTGGLTAYAVKLTDNLPPGLFFAGTKETVREAELGDIGSGSTTFYEYLVDIDEIAIADTYTNYVSVEALNHNPVEASSTIEVAEVQVLGIEMPATGFSLNEFLLLLSTLFSTIILGCNLRRKLTGD